MLDCTVKFCGGCNPRFERGEAYRRIRNLLSDIAVFSLPQDGKSYDVLLIIRGCTGCPYLYEEISAKLRVICASELDIDKAADEIRTFYTQQKG